MKYQIPVEWAMCDYVEVEADSFENAIKYFMNNRDDFPLGIYPEYIEGSYKINSEDEISSCGKSEDEYIKEITEMLFSFGYGQ